MADIIDCPHCHGRIIPTAANLCPSCGKNVTDTAEIKKSEIRDTIWDRVVAEQLKGRRFKAISAEMLNWPFPIAEIEAVQKEYGLRLDIFKHDAIWKMTVPGGAALVVGAGISFGSMFLAFEQGGGFYIVTYGLMLYGITSLITGLVRWYKAG